MMPPDFDPIAFQEQVEIELKPLYLKEQSPLAAMRLRSQTANSVAWLGPIALVGVAVFLIFVLLPLINTLATIGYGLMVAMVAPLPLLGLAWWLGRKRKEEQSLLRTQQQHIIMELETLEPGEQKWLPLQQRLAEGQKLTVEEQVNLLEMWEQTGVSRAEAMLEEPAVRAVLCPALQPPPRDVFRLSRIVTPLLLDEVEARKLTLPLVPVLFAGIAFLIHQRGIATFCSETASSSPTAGSETSSSSV